MLDLNERAHRLCEAVAATAGALRISEQRLSNGARLFDFGVQTAGGLLAGQRLAEVCLADLAAVQLVPGDDSLWPGPAIQVTTDHPLAACMGAQYAGWEVKSDDYFAMGSGPMRAAANREPIIAELGLAERPDVCVGVLESGTMPSDKVVAQLAAQCGVSTAQLTLLVAPTRSQAGTVQVVARSVETALHKLHELGFELARIESGWGTAPLPPVAANDLAGIGRTNDAILYGGQVMLFVRGDDASLQHIGPQIPSSASRDHGRPFAEIFAHYDHDFYQVDQHLFSPAVVTLVNLDTGDMHRYGSFAPEVLRKSFGS